MAVQMYMKLGEDIRMPSIGLGTWMSNDESELENAINAALEIGYRHIDTAFFYGNEHVIGKVIKEWIDAEKLTREDVFITTKLPIFGVHEDLVEEFTLKSLENLGLDYIDLYLIHFPVHMNTDDGIDKPKFFKTDHKAIWKKMEEQVESGRVKAIGLSNFNKEQVDRILKEARIKPTCLQIENHIYLQQFDLVKYCQENGIVVVGYSPFGSPGLNSFISSIGQQTKELPNLFQDPTVVAMSEKYNKTSAQILLRYQLQRDIVVIPKSVSAARLEENFNVFDFSISEEDMQQLKTLDVGDAARAVDFSYVSTLLEQPEWPWPAVKISSN